MLATFQWGQPYTFLHNRAEPLGWQTDVLADISAGLSEDPTIFRLAISSGKGAGKTALMAQLFLWHVACHPDSQTVCTSVTAAQASSRLWREVRKWRNVWTLQDSFTIQNQRLLHADSDTWFGTNQSWSEERPEAFQGVHEGHVAFIVDEASGIPDSILATIESGLTDANVFLCYASNPTRARGRFKECFTQRSHLWHCVTIDCRDVPTVNQERIKEQLDEVNGDVEASSFRINVRGLFPLEDYDQVVPDWLIEQACEREPMRYSDEDVFIGADIARFGSNKTVFTVRQGGMILERQTFRKLEVPVSAERLMDLADKFRFLTGRQPIVCIDADGIGAGVYDLVHESHNKVLEPYRAVPVHSGMQAVLPHRYINRRAELWFVAREWLRVEGSLDKNDHVLHEQLTAATYRQDEQGRMAVESKSDMASRGVSSPDEADSLIYSFATSVATLTRWT